MAEKPSITVLSDTYDLYMKKAKQAKEKGNLSLAKRNFLLASQTMMEMAKQSDGKLKEIRMDRARRLVKLTENIDKKPEKIEKKSAGENS